MANCMHIGMPNGPHNLKFKVQGVMKHEKAPELGRILTDTVGPCDQPCLLTASLLYE